MLRWRRVLLNMNRFSDRLGATGLELRRGRPEILQINVGKLCNLTCVHCHVNAGPKRKEVMTRATVDRIIDWLANTEIPTVDLTGGARLQAQGILAGTGVAGDDVAVLLGVRAPRLGRTRADAQA